ncbi:MAG: BlaI/MecI/CopY family transcriptional regulator [Thermodesulfobacteriota bacterium]|nr:MAG: BlaI/MecI/CopY family transcriptional regulator [Thermodesulfobacteriota bacterium]
MERTDKKNIFKEGPARVLGHLEQEIMDLLWSRGAMNGKDVHRTIKHERPIAITTVLTVLDRLVKKGLVAKKRGETVYLYKPLCTRDEFARELSGTLLKDIFEISSSSATASFVDMVADTSPEELDRLAQLVEEKRKELKG